MTIRAAIISPNPQMSDGGVERFSASMARLLVRLGAEVKVVGPTGRADPRLARIGLAQLTEACGAARAAREWNPDLVVSNGFLGAWLPRTIPRVHVFHGTMVCAAARTGNVLTPHDRLRRIVGGGFAEIAAAKGATTVAVSNEAAAEVRRYYRREVDAVIWNGVDEQFSPGDRATARARLGLELQGRYALFVGRVEPRKGGELLVPACAAAGYQLVVAGSSAPEGARSLGVLSGDDLVDAYRAADCVLLPTRYEACSFVVLEALSVGVPILTTAVGWTRTFLKHVPEYRSLIVSPDVASIAARLASLNGSAPTAVGPARDWVRRHCSMEVFEQRWSALLEDKLLEADSR